MLGELTAGSRVNLEPSLRVGDRLGGHFVTGHVEGVGTLVERHDERDWSTFWFRFPPALGRYMVGQGLDRGRRRQPDAWSTSKRIASAWP